MKPEEFENLGAQPRKLPVEIVVLPRSKVAGQLLSKSQGALYKSLLSIGDPGSRLPSGYRRLAQTALRLEFVDSVNPDEDSSPTVREIEAIIKFAPTIARLGGRCLIHCEAGVSRSTASAAIISRVILGPGAEAEAMDIACGNVADASPNHLMLEIADHCLRNEGRLVAARAAYFKG